MKMKKISIMTCLCLCLYFFFTGCPISREKAYYIPQTKMYVKTIYKPRENAGYIMFSNDSIMTLSKNIDYVKSSPKLSAIFILNTMGSNDIGIHYNGNVIEINSVKYHFIKNINEKDTMYYEKRYKTKPLIIKSPYMEFVIDDYFSSASTKEAGIEYYTDVKPMK